jgi:hypothetical protein
MKANNSFLLLFGVIIFAAAIYFGVKTVRTYSASANRDQLVSSIYDFALMAQKYYQEPKEKGGGGNTFERWSLPKEYENTEYGLFRAISLKKRVDICGVGNQTGKNGFTNVRVTARVDSSGIKVSIIN